MEKAKAIVKGIQLVLGTVCLVIVMYAVARVALTHMASEKANEVRVISVTPVEGTEYYEVLVEDENGEVWKHYAGKGEN